MTSTPIEPDEPYDELPDEDPEAPIDSQQDDPEIAVVPDFGEDRAAPDPGEDT